MLLLAVHSMRINGNKMKKDSFKNVFLNRLWIGSGFKGIADPDSDWGSGSGS
jgi:hypothetical protein